MGKRTTVAAVLVAVASWPSATHAASLQEIADFAVTQMPATGCAAITASYGTPWGVDTRTAIGQLAGPCAFIVVPGLPEDEQCAVSEHEIGHIGLTARGVPDALQHSPIQRNVMYAATIATPSCERRFGTIARWREVALRSPVATRCSFARRDEWAAVFSCRWHGLRWRTTVNYWLETTSSDILPPLPGSH